MDNYKQLEKTLIHIIKKMNDSRSIGFSKYHQNPLLHGKRLLKR